LKAEGGVAGWYRASIRSDHIRRSWKRRSSATLSGARQDEAGPHRPAEDRYDGTPGAFHAARAAAEAQGVHYAGRNRHSMSAVQADLGRQSFYSTEGPPPIRHWRKLVDEIRAAGDKRVVISSEFFADANTAAIRPSSTTSTRAGCMSS
jgi:hypothetical protein